MTHESDQTAQITKRRKSQRTTGKVTAMKRLLAILLGVALAGTALAASLMPQGKQAYFDTNGDPLSGGLLYTYAAGTSTPLATYSDQAGTIPNANPVVLDSRGEATIFWGSSPYKVALYTSAGVLIWTADNLYPPLTAGEPLKLYSGGNATTPELVWNDDTNSGFYLIGEDNIGLSIGGTKRWDYAASGSTLTGTLTVSGLATLGPVSASSITATDAARFLSSVTVSGVATLGPTVLSSTVTWLDASQLPPASISTIVEPSFVTTSATLVDVTNLSTTITSHGRSVLVLLQPASATASYIDVLKTSTGADAYVSILRDGTELARTYLYASIGGSSSVQIRYPPSSVSYIDTAPSAGAHTYKIQVSSPVLGATVTVTNVMLVVREL